MKNWLAVMMLVVPMSASADLYVTIIQGLGGNEYYSEQFTELTKNTAQAVSRLTGAERVKTITGDEATRNNILAYFRELQKKVTANDRTVMFLIGHGSYDGHQYKFNIPGPDLTGTDIGEIMKSLPVQLQLLVNTSSASGAIIENLKNDSRIIITATRSGNERNAPRFGSFFVAALSDHAADTNKNNSISAEEAFEYASRQTQDYYKAEGQLATEHPQLAGDRAAQLNIARLAEARLARDDPALAGLLRQRQVIDRQIEELQLRRENFSDSTEYFRQLQDLLINLSLLEEQIEALEESQKDAAEN